MGTKAPCRASAKARRIARGNVAPIAVSLAFATGCGSDATADGRTTPEAGAPSSGSGNGAGGGSTGSSSGGAGAVSGNGGRAASGNGGASFSSGAPNGGSAAIGGTTGGGGTTPAGGAVGAGGGGPDAGTPNLVADLLALTATCQNVVSAHSYALDNGQTTDICGLMGAVFFTADMDIDCDGKTTAECNAQTDCCYQADTAFHNTNDEPLTASVTPYVVIPQDFKYTGLRGGNVTAVIYQGKLEWAVFGDTGPTDIIGEASYACANDLGIDPDPKTGGTGGPVTYITFVGNGAAPADIENQTETRTLGETLAAALIADN